MNKNCSCSSDSLLDQLYLLVQSLITILYEGQLSIDAIISGTKVKVHHTSFIGNEQWQDFPAPVLFR